MRGGILTRNRGRLGTLLLIIALFSAPRARGISSTDGENFDNFKAPAYAHFILGVLASIDNDSQGALAHFQAASKFDSKSPVLTLKQAEENLNLGKVEEAKTLLKKIQATESKVADYQLLVARVASQEADVDSSLKALDQATTLFLRDKNPTKAREALLTKVALLADFKRYKESVSTLQSYLKRQPDDEISYYFLGKIHSIFQNRKEAKRAYQKALELRPNFLAAAKALGLQLELEGKVQEAMLEYQKVFQTNPNDEELVQKLVNLSLMNEDYPTALEYLKQYLILKPDDLQGQMRTALIHYKLKEYDAAKEIFESLLKNDLVAQDRIYFYLGTLSEEQEKYDQAQEFYEKVKPDSEYFVEARLQLAFIYGIKESDNSKALSSLADASALKPDAPELVLALAAEHERQSQLVEGIRVLTDATQRFKQNEKILFSLGTLLDRVGDFESAIQRMKEVLDINPNNPHALNHIGYSYAERNQHLDEAEALLKRAAQLAPENGFIQDSLGWTYFRMRKFAKAASFLERANKLSPRQPVVLEHLADTYQALGRAKDALAVYEEIMRWSAKDDPAVLPTQATIDENKTVQDRVRSKMAAVDVRHQPN